MWNSAPLEKFNSYFLILSLLILTKYLFWQEDWKLCYNCMKFRYFLKILSNWLSAKFFFLFYVLLKTNFVENSHIEARIFFNFLKSVLNQTSNAFNTKFLPQWTDLKSSDQVTQAFSLFFQLASLTSGSNSVKNIGENSWRN